jgi:hypothetical protein
MSTTTTAQDQYEHASRMSSEELLPHAQVSFENGDNCGECFCCMAWWVIYRRGIIEVPTPEFEFTPAVSV